MKKYLPYVLAAGIAASSAAATAQRAFAQERSSAAPPGVHGMQDGRYAQFMLEQQAKLLNLGVDELRARLDAGQTFAQIAEATGVTKDKLRATQEARRAERQSEARARLAARVANGKLTQQQADKWLARMDGDAKARFGQGRMRALERRFRDHQSQ